MNGYSKIRAFTPKKSRSIDFSDINLSPPPRTQVPQITKTSNKAFEPFPGDQQLPEWKTEEEEGGEIFGVILSRNCSVSSTSSASQRLGRPHEKNPQNSSLQSAVKRAFSMRRSSSVSERYCRIHDQWGPLSSPPQPHDGVNMEVRSKKKRGRIFKACKRLFGFS